VIEVAAARQPHLQLYGDRWPGLQAPQHTVLYDREHVRAWWTRPASRSSRICPTAPSPAFFYFFAGAAFKILQGKGLNLQRAIYPYFIGQLLFAPILAFEKQLNFAMQTVVCRRRA
jgi:hypothetical protein